MCETTKEVELTIRVRVPVEAKQVAVDENGEAWWYLGRPAQMDGYHAPPRTYPTPSDRKYGTGFGMATVTNWRETLTEV